MAFSPIFDQATARPNSAGPLTGLPFHLVMTSPRLDAGLVGGRREVRRYQRAADGQLIRLLGRQLRIETPSQPRTTLPIDNWS